MQEELQRWIEDETEGDEFHHGQRYQDGGRYTDEEGDYTAASSEQGEEDEEYTDPRFDWYSPRDRRASAPVPAPMTVRQKGPPKFVPLNKGKGWGFGKGQNKPTGQNPAMGFATPITHPSVIRNQYRPPKGMKKGLPHKGWTLPQSQQKGWIPPPHPNKGHNKGWCAPQQPQMQPMPMGPQFPPPPPPQQTAVGQIQPHASQMVPVFGFASMTAGMQPPMIQGPQKGSAPATRRRQRRKEHHESGSDSSTSTSSRHRSSQKKRKRTRTVWLNVRGGNIKAKYRA